LLGTAFAARLARDVALRETAVADNRDMRETIGFRGQKDGFGTDRAAFAAEGTFAKSEIDRRHPVRKTDDACRTSFGAKPASRARVEAFGRRPRRTDADISFGRSAEKQRST